MADAASGVRGQHDEEYAKIRGTVLALCLTLVANACVLWTTTVGSQDKWFWQRLREAAVVVLSCGGGLSRTAFPRGVPAGAQAVSINT